MSYFINKLLLNDKIFIPNNVLLFLFSIKLILFGSNYTYNFLKNNWSTIIDFIDKVPVPYPSEYFLFTEYDCNQYNQYNPYNEKIKENKKEINYEEKYLDSFYKCDNFFIYTEEEEKDVISKIDELKNNKKNLILNLKNKIEYIKNCIYENKMFLINPVSEYNTECDNFYSDYLQEGYSLMDINSLTDDDSLPDLIPIDNYSDSMSFCPVSPVSPVSKTTSNYTKNNELIIQLDLLEKELIVEETYKEDYFVDLANDCIINIKKNNLKNNVLIEKTPLGNVLMYYDNSDDSFVYYSDNTIPYRFLEVVARRYVVVFKCKPVYVDMKEVLKEIKDKTDAKVDGKTDANVDVKTDNKNVFAKFKSYNKNISKTFASIPAKQNNQSMILQTNNTEFLKERSNKYVWKGKMMDFIMIKKIDKKINDKRLAMTFSEFKKMKM